jgi:hypothetical protein
MKNEIFECKILENEFAYLTSSKYTDEFIDEHQLD